MPKLILSAALLISAFMVLLAAPFKHVVATCSGSSCNGLNPISTGCADDAYVVASATIFEDTSGAPLGTIYYKWSPTCQAGYGQTDTNGDPAALIVAQIFASSTVYGSNTGHNLSTIVSPLLSASDSSALEACGAMRIGPHVGEETGGACTP